MWHPEAITAAMEKTLRLLKASRVVDPFYLAGGTGLALHFGHRRSTDLDLFSPQLFDENTLLAEIGKLPAFALSAISPSTVHAFISNVKVSMLGYDYPVLFSQEQFLGIAVADARDIACMKISALATGFS